MSAASMSADTVKFNVGGTVFEVARSTIQTFPHALLAKMIDGPFQSGKDGGGAYFVDRNPQMFNIILDVHRDNKVYESPMVTSDQVVAELQFYGLHDFADGYMAERTIPTDEASEERLVAFCKEMNLETTETFQPELAGSSKLERRLHQVSKLRTLLKDTFKGAVTLDDCAKMTPGKGEPPESPTAAGSARVKLQF